METLNPLEKAVFEKLLSGESETYRILQKQYSTSRVADRKMTGVGSDDAPKLPDEATFHIADVAADISDLEHGAGFVLFIRKGGINMLEGFTYGEPWPRNVRSFHLYYDGTSKRK
jgi:hypothetical protein